MLKKIIALFKALNANTHPGELAHAMACGFLLGLMPKNNLLWYVLMVFILFLKINKPSYVIFMFLGSLAAPLLDPYFDQIGYIVLTYPNLTDVYRTLYDVPFVGFTRFNNTIVTGSLVGGVVAYLPVYLVARGFVALWRKYIATAIVRSKLYKVITKLPLAQKVRQLAED